MRNNLEDNLIRSPRIQSPSYVIVEGQLSGAHIMLPGSPRFNFFEPLIVTQNIYLPEIPPQGGLEHTIVNMSASVTLAVYNDVGVLQATVQPLQAINFISSFDEWTSFVGFPVAYNDLIAGLLANPRVVTGDFVVGAADLTIAVQRAAPVLTLGTLPAVATRLGKPVAIVDWSSAIVGHEIRLTPNGAETIMQQATWSLWSNPGNLAGVTLWPSTTLGGWYIKP